MTRDDHAVRPRRAAALRRPTTRCSGACPGVGGDAARPAAGVGGRRAVDQPRARPLRAAARSCRRWRSGRSSCSCCSASRMLTMVYVTSSPIEEEIVDYYLGLLPGHHPEPCATPPAPGVGRRRVTPSPQRQAARTTAGAARDPRPDPRPEPQPPDPLHDHRARARRRAQPRDPGLRLGPAAGAAGEQVGCRRLFDEVGVRAPVGAEDLPRWTTWSTPSPGCGSAGRDSGAGDREDQRGRVGLRQRLGRPVGTPGAREPGRAGALRGRAPRHAARGGRPRRWTTSSPRSSGSAGSWRSGSPARRSQSQRADAGAPRRRGRAPLDPRPAPRRGERPEVPRLRVPRRSGVLPQDHRARHGHRPDALPARACWGGSPSTS